MRHLLEPRERIYVKGYGFMSFARSMSNKYGKKLVDTVLCNNIIKNGIQKNSKLLRKHIR